MILFHYVRLDSLVYQKHSLRLLLKVSTVGNNNNNKLPGMNMNYFSSAVFCEVDDAVQDL